MNNMIVPVMLKNNIELSVLYNYIELYKPDYIYLPSYYNQILKTNNNFVSKYSKFGYELIKTPYNEEFAIYKDLSILLTTSGSTGDSKFVRCSYTNIITNMNQIISYLNIDSSNVTISTMPMNYSFGLSIINSYITVGACLILTKYSVVQNDFWVLIDKYKVNSLSGVPYTFEILDKLNFFDKNSMPNIQIITQAGGKLASNLCYKIVEWSLKYNKKFIVMYGQTEASPRMSYLPYKYALDKLGSIGIPVPNGKFVLIDFFGKLVKQPNVIGEIVYYGKNVALGYANSGFDLIKADNFKGKLFTGDIGIFDNDHFYYILGRKNRFIKIFGNRVNLDHLEELIKLKSNYTELACIGNENNIKIYIDDKNRCEQIKNIAISITKFNQIVFSIYVIDGIPRNKSGKVLYNELGI